MAELSPFAHRVQLVTGLIAACAVLAYLTISPGIEERALGTLEKIQKRGHLRVLTLNSATTYYQDSEGLNGFEYQLASWFAESIGVEARFIIVPGFTDIYPELLFGSGDIAAAGLSENDSRYSGMVAYGPSYHEVRKQVLYRKFRADRPRNPSRKIGLAALIIFHQKSALQTNSKADSCNTRQNELNLV